MALENCPECGGLITNEEGICPHCGCILWDRYIDRSQKGAYTAGIDSGRKVQKTKKSSGMGCLLVFFVLCILLILAVFWCGIHLFELIRDNHVEVREYLLVDDMADNDTEGESEADQETDGEKLENNNKIFLKKIKKHMGGKSGQKVYKILKNEIGFTELVYKGNNKKGSKYTVQADGYKVIIVIKGRSCQIYTPGVTTWYKNNQVKITVEKMKRKEMKKEEDYQYYQQAKFYVTGYLLYSSYAKFPSYFTEREEISVKKDGNLIHVRSYVDAENRYGVENRNAFVIQFMVDKHGEVCEITYVNVGDIEIGEYQAMP